MRPGITSSAPSTSEPEEKRSVRSSAVPTSHALGVGLGLGLGLGLGVGVGFRVQG